MDTPKPNPFLKNERQKTDDSLIAERDKTNESITKSRERTEQDIDKEVHLDRLKSDQKTSDYRIEADSLEDNKREFQGQSEKLEHEVEDHRLHDERDHADKAIELERARVDVSIDRERELKNAMASRLLKRERALTDRNLSKERDLTDSEVQNTSMLLNHEIDEHSKTKVSLTTRDEFLAIVSHDLRNPIGAASSCAEMLLEDASYKEMGSEIRYWVEFIKRNVDTSLRLIEDLLDMETMAQGKLHLRLNKHIISHILLESVEFLSPTASAKSIHLQALPTNTVDQIICDKDRIMQVLSNLIGNALKFTPEGGSITISSKLTETEIQISVSDTGPGIQLEMQDHIFDRFAQLGSKDRSGLGLGLHICKMLIEAHRGRLWVESKMGVGSTFLFTIPRLDP